MSQENPAEEQVEVEAEPVQEAGEPSPDTTARLTKMNQQLGLFLSLSAKLVVVLGVTMAVTMILGQILRAETFSIGRLDVPGQLQGQGYTSALIARQVAADMRAIVDRVPDKLLLMFISADTTEEEKQRIEESIAKEYDERKDEVNINLSFGIFDLPIDQFLVHLRGWLGIDSTTVESSITIQETTLSMSVGLVKNGATKELITLVEELDPHDPNKIYVALDRLIQRTAQFILEKNHPIVMILQDYHQKEQSEGGVYSDGDKYWTDRFFDEETRIEILEDRVADPPDDSKQIRKWANAVLGVIREQRHESVDAIRHYEGAIKADPAFVDTVGRRLASLYPHHSEDPWAGCEKANAVLEKMLARDASNRGALEMTLATLLTQRGLIADQPRQTDALETVVRSYEKLLEREDLAKPEELRIRKGILETHAMLEGQEDEFYKALRLALERGLQLTEDDYSFPPLNRYAEQSEFRNLLGLPSG